MSSFKQYMAEERRARILQALLNSGGYTAGESMLDVFLAACGHKISASQLRADLAWLAELELIRVRVVEGTDMQLATLTRYGQDVAEDRTTVPGVKRLGAEI